MAADAETVALFRKQLELCDVGPGTSLAVLSEDDVRAEHATAFLAAASELEADAFQVNIRKKPGSFFGPGNSLQGNEPAKAALKSVDMVVDLVGLLWSREQTEITDAGPRMLLVIEPIDVLKRMVSNPGDRRRIEAASARLGEAKEMRITSPGGTDVTYRFGGYRIGEQYGYTDEPGRWDHWPGVFLYTAAVEDGVDGTVVIDTGDQLLLPTMRYVTDPITLTVESGMITDIAGPGLDCRAVAELHGKLRRSARLRGLAYRLGARPEGALGLHGHRSGGGGLDRPGRARVLRQRPVLDRSQHRGRRRQRHAVPYRHPAQGLHAYVGRRDDRRERPRRAGRHAGRGPLSLAEILPREERFQRRAAGFRTLDLEQVAGVADRRPFDAVVFPHRAPPTLPGASAPGASGSDETKTSGPLELAEARAEVEPGIGAVDPRFPLARTAQHGFAGLRVPPRDRARHQRVPALDPAREALRPGETGGERRRVREAVRPCRRPFGEAELETPRDLVRPVARRRDQRRVEQRERIPLPAMLQRMPYRRYRRDRVEHADRRLGAETLPV